MIFIAEIGLNHNGNFDLAYELMRQAKRAGADIVKFQLGWRDKSGELNHINEGTLQDLQRWADSFQMEIMFSIFTEEAFELALKYNFPRFKIASRTLIDNFDLARKIVNMDRETYVSLGMWNRTEMPFPYSENVRYLWCKSKYPTYPWDLIDFPKDFSKSPFSGYSDHSIGIETALLAVSRGARVVEKHFTLDKSDTTIRDHVLSATPEEFRLMVCLGREIHRAVRLGV